MWTLDDLSAEELLVLIRGGGDGAEFDVFDQKLVVEAWGSKPAFKALGLGHEGTARTLLDFISDYVGSTPTAVGGFLAQQIATLEQRRQVALAAQEQRAQLEEQNRSLRAELARAEERQAAVSKAADEAAAHKRKRILIAAAFLIGIALIVGALAGYRLAR